MRGEKLKRGTGVPLLLQHIGSPVKGEEKETLERGLAHILPTPSSFIKKEGQGDRWLNNLTLRGGLRDKQWHNLCPS